MKYCILLLVVGTALGVPVLQDAEDVQCSSLFQYKKQYVFTYTGTSKTGIVGTHDETSDTTITCQEVEIKVPQKCVVVLKTRQCQITPSTEQTVAFTQSMERYELMARVHNGLITEVLPHVDEPLEILNVKKGILSALQMEWHGQIQEEVVSNHLTIHGNCSTTTTHVPTTFEFTEEFTVTRDLSMCTMKPTRIPVVWPGLSYLQNLDIGSQLINSSQFCHVETYDINFQHMQRVECREVHSFWPMSISNDRGIMTEVTQVLEQQSLDKLNSLDFKALRYDKRSTNIIQEIREHEAPEELSVDEAMEYIKDLVKSTLDEVKMDSPRKFGDWVKALRSLNNDTIHEVFDRTYYCEKYSEKCVNTFGKAALAREYLWDGLMQCGTLPCFSVVNTAIIKNIIPKPLAHIMMYTMAFRDYPSYDIIAEGVRLAKVNRTRSTFLPVSTMIYKYWVDHPEIHNERELPAAIQDFVQLLNDIINNDCSVTSLPKTPEFVEDERQILLAIKALGNLGPVAQKFDETEFRKRLHFERELLKCAVNKKVSFNISISAIQALRRFNMSSLSGFVIDNLKQTFLNTSYDIKLRIAAYLIYMKTDVMAANLVDIYQTLKTEPVKQFKAFTFSHISNVLVSEDPTVQRLRKELILAIGEEELPEYPRNIFKYSRNMEISKMLTIPYFNKTFGGSIESNLIYNPDTIMPKSMMLKYAISALGKDYDLIETGWDVQGYEAVMESIFGPAGFFPNNVMRTLFREMDEKIMSRIRTSSISFDWLARLMDIITSPNPAKEIQAASSSVASSTKKRTNDFIKSMKDAMDEPAAEPEPVPEDLLPGDLEENLANIHDVVNKEQKERLASIYLRVLGNELGFLTTDDIKSLIPTINKQMVIDMFNEMGTKLSEGMDLNTTRSLLFLEREMVLPTGLGMPLNCSANGSVVVSIRTRGQLSIQLPSAVVSGRLAPSVGVEILGTMGVQVPTTKIHAGVMANASVYHSSQVEGNVTINGPHLKVQVKALEKPMNLLNFSVNYFLLKPDGEMSFIPGIMQDAVKVQECANPGKFLGMSLCLSFAYPNASYVDIAPRFPLTGPLSFNITLNNTDQTLGAYIFEAEYKMLSKGGAKPSKTPTKKSFGSIGKKTTYVPPEEVIDTLQLNFSAPGDMLRRDILTKLTFHRNKTEAKWTFDVPEMDGLKIFAGLLNISDKTTGEMGMHLVWNATYNEKKTSVSLTMKNSSVEGKTNITGVFNASVEQLYFSVVGQLINTDTFMIASLNDTYYWDDETPIYEQLTWPVSGYTIKPEKYHSSVSLIKTMISGPNIDRVLFLSSLGQNFTIESNAVNRTESYTNEISSKFENSYVDWPLLDISFQYDKAVRQGQEISYSYVDIHRGEHCLFYQADAEKELATNTLTRNYTFGVKTLQKVKKSEFADITDQTFLEKFGDEIYELKPVNLNTSLLFVFNNETITPPSYFASLNATIPVPQSLDLTKQTRWGLGFTTRFINETTSPSTFGYVIQLNNTIPFLLLDFSNEFVLSNDTSEGLKVAFSHQTLERKYGKHMDIDMFGAIDLTNMKMKNGINFTSPYYNFTGGFTAMIDEVMGMVIKNKLGQNGVLLSSLTDFAEDYYFTMKLWQNGSIGFHLTHKLVNISTDHLMHIEGPVTNFSISLVPFFIRDVINKTYHQDFAAVQDTFREVSYKITNSSALIDNTLVIKTPYIMNVTMDHHFFLDMNKINHTLVTQVKSPLANMNVDHALLGPEERTDFFTLNSEVTGNIGSFTEMSTVVTGKAKRGKSVNSNMVLTSTWKTPSIANFTTGGSFTIKGLKSATKFDLISMQMEQQVDSILGQSNVVSFVNLDTFKRLWKFSKSEAQMEGTITSRFLNWTSLGGVEITGSNEFLEFDRLNSSAKMNITSPVLNFTSNSSSEVNGLSGIFVADSIKSSNDYHVDSILGNADYNLGFDLSDIESPLAFQRLSGSSDFTITSRLMNLTTSNKMGFHGVHSIFRFGKVNGSVEWNLTSVVGDAMMNHTLQLVNFQNWTTFETAELEMIYGVASKYLGKGNFSQVYGLYDMTGILRFREAKVAMVGEMETKYINSSMASLSTIRGMNGLLHSDLISSITIYNTTSRFLNVTGEMAHTTQNMGGLFVFDLISNRWEHISTSPILNMSIGVGSSWDRSRGFMNHNLLTNRITLNVTSPLGNLESVMLQTSKKSRSLFNFRSASLMMNSGMKSKYLNTSVESSVTATGFRSCIDFDDVTAASLAEIKIWKLMNVSAAMETGLTNYVNISFDKFFLSQNATLSTPVGVLGGTLGSSMTNLRGVLQFDAASAFGGVDLTSQFINFTAGMEGDMMDSRGLLNFGNLRWGTSINSSSPLHVFNNSLGFEISNMEKLTTSSRIAAGMTSSLKTKLASLDSTSGVELLGQTSLFVFDKAAAGANFSITSKFVNASSTAGSEMTNSLGFLKFESLQMGSSGSINTTIMSMKTEAGMVLSDMNGFLKFESLQMGSSGSINTTIMSMKTEAGLTVSNMDGLFKFDSLEMGSSGSINTTIASMKAEGGMMLMNQNGLFTFSKGVVGGKTVFSSKLANMTMEMETKIVGQEKLMHFEEFLHNTTVLFVSKPLSLIQGYHVMMEDSTGLFRNELFEVVVEGNTTGIINSTNKFRYAVTSSLGFGVYDELNMSNVMGLTSRFLNGSSTNSFIITSADGLLTFAKGVGSMNTSISTPIGDAGIVNNVDMTNFNGFMVFSGMDMTGKMVVGKLLTAEGRAQLVNFNGPFVFDKVNVTGAVNTISVLANYSGNMAYEARNGGGLFEVSKVIFTANQRLTSIIANGTTEVLLSANRVQGLTALSRANATVAWALTTKLASARHGTTILLRNVESMVEYDLFSVTSNTGIVSKPANITTSLVYSIEGRTGLFAIREEIASGNITMDTIIGKLTHTTTFGLENYRSYFGFDQMSMTTLTTAVGPVGAMTMSGEMLMRNAVNVTFFDHLSSEYAIKMTSMPLNVTSSGSFHVEDSQGLFQVSRIEGSMIHNITVPFISTNMSYLILVTDMISWNSFNDLSVVNEVKMNTPYSEGSTLMTISGQESWGNVADQLETSLVTPKGSVIVSQLIDYENAKVSLTVPSYGYIHLHAHLNEFGDEFTVKMKHILESKSPDMVEDFRLLVKLNKSDVIYTNFSWNPEVVAELLDISTDALNRTINFTMTVFNETKERYIMLKDLSIEKYEEMKKIMKIVMDDPREFIEEYIDLTKYDEIMEKVMEVVEFARENPKEALANVYDLVKVTAEQTVNVTLMTYKKLDERFMLQEKIVKVNETIQDIIFFVTHPKESWELVKPQIDFLVSNLTEAINYELIKTRLNEIVDIPKLNQTLREYLQEINKENLLMILEEMKLLVNTTKVTEVINSLTSLEINVGCVTFKDLAQIDMETIDNAYIKIKEFIMLDNLKQFVNISQVEIVTDRINKTIRINLDVVAWNKTLHSFIDVPLLNATLFDLFDYVKDNANQTLETIIEKAQIQLDKLKVKLEELQVTLKEAVQLVNDTILEISGLNWPELKEKVTIFAMQLNETLYEKFYENVDMSKVTEILEQIRGNITSRIDMEKINLAIEKLNTTIYTIINATKNETHAINILPMKYFETTIYDFMVTSLDKVLVASEAGWDKMLTLSDVYGEKAFELTKEYGKKAVKLVQEYRVKAMELYNNYSVIVIEKSKEYYVKALKLSEEYKEKVLIIVENITEEAKIRYANLSRVISEYVVKVNVTVYNLTETYYPVVYEFIANNTEKGLFIVGNITEILFEKSKPYVVVALDRLNQYKNQALLQSADVCINVTNFIDATIEKLPEYQELLLELTENYTQISKELWKNVTILTEKNIELAKEKLVLLDEWRKDTMATLVEITKNEENLLNYYPVEWTGKTVNVIVLETVELVKMTVEDLKIKAEEKLEELKEVMADKSHFINRYPSEYLGMTIMELYEDVKENVTVLIEQGKEYIVVAKTFFNDSIETINATLVEYNITRERLDEVVVQLVNLANETLTNFTKWVEIAMEQPYDVTFTQIVDFANKTVTQALEIGNITLIRSIDMANKTLNYTIELWNNLTRQENLDKIPVLLEKAATLLNETFHQVNETIQDAIVIARNGIKYIREDSGLVEKVELYREQIEVKIAELKVNVTKYLEKVKSTSEEIIVWAKDDLFSRTGSYVEYLNNTLPGWMYRYYKVDALPFQLWNYTIEKGNQTFHELTVKTIEYVDKYVCPYIQFNYDDHSFALNFTHPFNWTSFRQLPTLTNAQKEALIVTRDEIMNRLILPSQVQIERLTELLMNRYIELIDYITVKIEENRPVVEARLDELKEKIKETQQKIKQLRADFEWSEFKEQVKEEATERYSQAKEFMQVIRENATVLFEQLKENITQAYNDVKENYPLYVEKVKELSQNLTNTLIRFQEEFPETVSHLLEQISDLTRQMYLPTDLPHLIKPWTYSSMIFGKGHVMTFDGHIYEFPGYQDRECTYLLARDFVDGNFTLLTKQFSTMLVLKTCTIKIDQDGLVFIDGNPVPQSTPFVAPNNEVVVTRDGPWVNVTTTHGIELLCHEGHFMCVYRLSGWYYAKTQGLLGNLDTEHFNELIKPDGTIANTLIDFANSYEVTGLSQCQIPANFELPEDPSCFTADQNTIKEKCRAIFSSESFLVPIYDTINPEPFLQTCLEMAEKCMDTDKIVNPYITLGRIEGIFINISYCADTSRMLEEPCIYPRPLVVTSDIVFIISEHYSMLTGVTETELKQHIKELYVSIRSQYPDSKFAVVAYGGPEYEHCAPHLHSNEMESFTSGNFDRAVESLEFCDDSSSCTCSPSKGDALKAVLYASDLLLRDSAGKVFILIDNNEQEYDESTRLIVADTLANNSVTVNVISKYSQLEKTIGKVPIIGVNYDGHVLFNKRNSAESITEVLDTPKGTYAKLATATEGAMLGINYLQDGNTDLQPVLKKLLKKQIGDYAAKTNIDCKSVWDIYGRPSSKCFEP
ncbi:hypothetical protein HOLleu_15014 [Holothuria leucospilota]|uniref:Vitellogenin domain-containing protein n=1 Tax=Holothuria leucospilota TaxID=206669 RepID=A0A9Q1C9Q7_HOLLE|nr:hypothetical protein HOLleu_15014 [Holothuria leucospilota]